MTSATDRPTLWEIRSCLLSSLDFADGYAHHRPEHAGDAARFLRKYGG